LLPSGNFQRTADTFTQGLQKEIRSLFWPSTPSLTALRQQLPERTPAGASPGDPGNDLRTKQKKTKV